MAQSLHFASSMFDLFKRVVSLVCVVGGFALTLYVSERKVIEEEDVVRLDKSPKELAVNSEKNPETQKDDYLENLKENHFDSYTQK